MLKINSLFWKIFLAFWLANLAVMLVTTFVVLQMNENGRQQERHRERIEQLAGYIVDSYERGQTFPSQFENNQGRPPPPFSRLAHRIRTLTIIDPGNKIIYDLRPRREMRAAELHMTVTSQSGLQYKVISENIRIHQFVVDAIKKINTIRFLLILFFSGLVSLLLTWAITQPLKKLGWLSRKFADGELSTRVDQKLLSRGDEIGDLARDFNQMAERISLNIESQQQLLYDVSHELRAPLARLQAAAALIEQTPDNIPEKVLGRIDYECQRMDTLIQLILEYSKLESATVKVDKIELINFLNNIIDNIQYEYQDHPITLLCDAASIPAMAFPELLHRALENILRNACKHTPSSTPIQIELRIDAEHIVITVRDHGPGVNQEDVSKLLTPFFRGGNTSQTEGSGLGLSIAQRAIHKHRGQLEISNHSQGGLQVDIKLPINLR